MRFWLTSLAIFAEFLAIVTASSLRGRRDSPTSLQNTTNEAGNDVCVKPACYDIASSIKNSMNLTVNPCDDFYKYTCGNFGSHAESIGSNIIKGISNETITRNIEILGWQFNLQLKSQFESDNEIDDIKPFKQARTMYKSCMNEEAIESKGHLLLKEFTQAFGGWPVVEGESWNESNFDWMRTIADWNRAGWQPNCFINIRMQVDKQNTSQRAIHVNRPYFVEYLMRIISGKNINSTIRDYHPLKVDIAESLGVDRKTAEAELMEVLEFRLQLQKTINVGRATNLRMTLNELIERYPSVDWRNILTRMFSPMQTIADTDVIVVSNPMFIDPVIRLLSTTPKRVQANYAMFQLIEQVYRYMNRATTRIWEKYLTIDPYSSRFEQCMDTMKKKLSPIVAAMYMKKFFTPEKKNYAEDILRKIKQEFRATLDEVSFLDNETRAFAKEKESAIKDMVGYPEGVLTDDNLNDYYRQLEFLDNEYLINYLRLIKFNYEKTTADISKPSSKINPASIRTLFKHLEPQNDYDSNTIEIPAHMLQENIFDLERPDYMNFATLGTMIGYEVTHVFSSPGDRHGLNGTRKNWWTTAAKQDFDERTKCFGEQYGKYVIDNENNPVDVVATLDSNVADNAALKMAYRAYVNTMHGKVPEKRLPDLDQSPNKMFWIAYANMFCEKVNTRHWSTNSEYAIHAPPHARVIETLSNSKEFAKDFECPRGSKMNPIKKCSAW